MQRSCTSYDSGYVDEAKRIATIIRILFHDTNRSKSLLKLLNIKNNLALFDSASEYDPKNLVSHDGLTALRIGNGTSSYIPRLEDMSSLYAKGKMFFPKWWNKVVIVDQNKNSFTRRDLILAITNKDGGAHIDPKLDATYAQLTRQNSMGWIFTDGNVEQPIRPIELASVRQIAHEVIMTFKSKYPEFVS